MRRSAGVGGRLGAPNEDWTPPDVDWSRLIDLAGGHGVLALVARDLKRRGWDGVPPDVVATLAGYRTMLTARNLSLTRQLLEVLELLTGRGITAVPYKGPVLAAYVYGDVGMRPFGDLDLILSERDVLPARDLLISEGYRSLSPRTDERAGGLPPGYALALGGGPERAIVELHWRLAPSFPLTIDRLLPHTRPFPLLDSSVPCLCPEQLLLALCVHGGKHAWERYEWISGVAHLIARHPDLDWDRVAVEAKELGATHSVALGLSLAVVAAGAPVPAGAMAALGSARVMSLATEMEEALLRGPPQSGGAVTRYSLRLRATSAKGRLRYLLFLRLPTEKDLAFVRLPERLSFLYFLVRPLRVVYELAERVIRGRWQGRRSSRHAERALARQLEHQAQKASALRGREDQMAAALAERWGRVQRRLQRVEPGWDDPRMLEVGSGAHGILFGSGSRRAIGIDPLAVQYAGLFPAWQRNVPTVAAVGERLPFADATFDVVLCDNVVDHAERPTAIVSELARLLVPGGLLYFTVNVHHRLYSILGRAHRAWNAAGIPLEIGPFADHTVHLTPAEARALFAGLPLDICRETVYLAEAKERARRRRLRHPGHLLPLVFFKNARCVMIAQRR
ncbi:MAG TPA: nucleotidyltransferase family protein [Acidimicrobiales bacterium]|nr:nucleotidyltransferase family protein [Acidimicrobiales bacterium]